MLRPVGSLPHAVYWRRRFALLGALVLLIVLTAWVLRPAGGKHQAASNTAHPTPSSTNAALSTPSSPVTSHATTTHPATSPKSSRSATRAAAPVACTAGQLKVAAVVGQPSYHVGDHPTVLPQ